MIKKLEANRVYNKQIEAVTLAMELTGLALRQDLHININLYFYYRKQALNLDTEHETGPKPKWVTEMVQSKMKCKS